MADKNTTKTYTDTEAQDTIRRIADENQYAVRKDIDALLEVGEVDFETVLCGYLWDAVVAEVGEMDEDTEEVFSSAIVDFFCEQVEF